ncbi:Protein N-acetyltransferase, RimJ/RimL family [Promicromonospora umidemergens]|uniref:N-acetyltransferase domain-containing protein n=1 Tax=Promicromonospora umidemergens TaxID=629679 RepID=A0ABP8WEU9_9MICO|nr:GNAT family N-acetyltransferase [Promicromonospora umidemergens]MCP2284136.1 Protein N-acetyltransferase, RimJ/RimL family [Promicromonospora umidemergens]
MQGTSVPSDVRAQQVTGTYSIHPVATVRVGSASATRESVQLADLPLSVAEWEAGPTRIAVEADPCDHAAIDTLIRHGFVLDPVARALRPEPPSPLVFSRDDAVPTAASWWLPDIPSGGIRADGLVLTHPRPDDLDDLLASELDPGVREYSIFEPMSREELALALDAAYYHWRVGTSSMLIARTSPSGPVLAKVSVRRVVPPGVLDVGYVTVRAHRGCGISSRAVRGFTRWAFERAGIQRIEMGIKSMNRPSVAVAERAGYHGESVRKSRLSNRDGSYSDELSYVAISQSWGEGESGACTNVPQPNQR